MAKTFNIVGVSRVRANAPLKLRVANGKNTDSRTKVLVRNGHADVMLVALETAVDKIGARAFLATNHPELFAQLKVVKVKGEKAAVVETAEAPAETAAVVETAAEAPAETAAEVVLTPEAKLALKRAKDAERKRAKRAAEKAAQAA